MSDEVEQTNLHTYYYSVKKRMAKVIIQPAKMVSFPLVQGCTPITFVMCFFDVGRIIKIEKYPDENQMKILNPTILKNIDYQQNLCNLTNVKSVIGPVFKIQSKKH